MVTHHGTRLPQRHNLGVRRGIVAGQILVPSPRDYSPIAYQHGSYRNFSGFQRPLRRAQRFFHEQFIRWVSARRLPVINRVFAGLGWLLVAHAPPESLQDYGIRIVNGRVAGPSGRCHSEQMQNRTQAIRNQAEDSPTENG